MQSSSAALSFRKFIPAIIWFVLVFVLLCLPGDNLPEIDNWLQSLHPDKIVHVFLFGVMSYLFMAPPGRAGFTDGKKMTIFIAIGAACCLWGLATEFIQKYFVPGRNFDVTDWLSDTCGSAAAIIIARFRFR
jgi:hypothetical protein